MPHTSGTPLNSRLYVSLLAYVRPYTHICIRAQNSCSVQVDTMDLSLSNSMPMDLLNATVPFSVYIHNLIFVSSWSKCSEKSLGTVVACIHTHR